VTSSIQQVAADSVRTVLRDVFASGEYRWHTHRDPLRFLKELYWDAVRWLLQLHETHPVAYWAIVGAMTVVLVTLLVHLGYILSRAFRPREDSRGARVAAATENRDAAWHLRAARRLAAAGQFREAVTHRFVALLLELDERHIVRYDPSKTPAEYVDEAVLDDRRRGALRMLVGALYDHVFGGTACTAQDLDAFHRSAGTIVRGSAAA
jgi:Domain of unknown function (DUF4129)